MKVIAINGGPRKNWNTATLMAEALKGAEQAGAQTELIHLYDLNYKGCTSCFACKLKGGKSYGMCAVQDDLQPVLRKIEQADALLLGSPIYLGNVTGEMRSFMERLVFQYLVYDADRSSLFKNKIPVGLIYTLGAPEEQMRQMGFDKNLESISWFIGRTLGSAESLFVNDTYQFEDYSKYESSRFDPVAKAKRREEVFPLDCKKAFEMGVWLSEQK
ncbi:MAG: flavodoxin family protein [Eubacteriales bacterium]